MYYIRCFKSHPNHKFSTFDTMTAHGATLNPHNPSNFHILIPLIPVEYRQATNLVWGGTLSFSTTPYSSNLLTNFFT